MDRLGISWPILHLLFILWFSSTLARNLEIPRYETAYACEGKTLKIECKEGELIRLIRANYGRFSITICNDHGNTDWSVNCMSPKSLRVLHNRCSQNQNCSILASTSTFGDPCVGTLKYLEAHYQCMPATTTTTTNRPSPPWLITSEPPSVWSTVKPTARPPPPPPRVSALTTSTPPPAAAAAAAASASAVKTPAPSTAFMATTPHHHHHQQQPSKQPAAQAPAAPAPAPVPDVPLELDLDHPPPPEEITTLAYTTVLPRKLTEDSTVGSAYVPSSSVPWTQTQDVHYCGPTTARNLYWNWTRVNERTVQPCPGGATGLAHWRCVPEDAADAADGDPEPRWHPATPDLSECRSVWLTSLESRVIEGDSLISITSDLSQVTSSKTLYGGDMMITTKIIKKMAQKMSEDIQTFPDQRQREAIVTELLHGVVRTGSNLLDSSQHPSWRDLSHKEQMRVATSLLIGLEENAFLLADTVVREKTVVQTVKNIMLSVRVLETKNIKTETFPSEAATDKWSASNDWLQLPREALLENSEGGLVRLVFVAFDRLEEILQWQPEAMADTAGTHRNLSRVLNSKVISASLGKGRHIQLSQPVRLFLRHLKTENVSNPSCVFWDYTMNTWSEEGCHVESTNRTHTTCLCDHLTNFAILMDVHATYLPAAHQMALQIITYVGCIVSIGCLILTIITFQTFRGLKSDRTTIHKNLCFCLLVAELLFVIGIGRTSERVLCGVVAGLLHLFFLCAFAWMFLEGFQLYVMLIEVFEAEKSRIRWYYLVAYGVPLLIVSISAIVDPFSYGTEQYCWLRADNFFIFSFVGPVILVILANIVFLVMAIVMMCRHGNASVSMKSKEHSRLASARTWLRGAFVLVFLLGLTWTFGLLYLNKESVVMAYVFTTLNSLQGMFIFVFHCVQNEKVRKEYRKFIRRHSWLPKCLRCSKPSAGAAASSGSGSGGSGLGKERRTSLYGGSNGNTSAPNSHSTDNSGLSPHGTSQYVLQRDWSSRSCTTVNRIVKSPVPAPASVPVSCAAATMAATTSRNSHLHLQHSRPSGGNSATSAALVPLPPPGSTLGSAPPSPTPTPSPTPSAPPLSHQPPLYDDDLSANAVNTATLPYFRNFYKSNCTASVANNGNNIISNPNFPKSISTWGPLHKPLHWKNISFKSYSRDSGHGGSEQEDSPRSHMIGSNVSESRLNSMKDCRRQPYMSSELAPQITLTNSLSHNAQAELSEYLHAKNENKHLQQQTQPASHQHFTNRKKNCGGGGPGGGMGGGTGGGAFLRSASPWNHTYTEIHDGRMHRERDRLPMSAEDEPDPVYEEIERNEIQVSDMSDEDGKRQSDMSRQSSRSYGDHRPLIPYSPAADRSIHSCLEGVSGLSTVGKHQRAHGNHGSHGNFGSYGPKEHGRYASDLDQYHRMGMGLTMGMGMGMGLGSLGLSRQNVYRTGSGSGSGSGAGENARSLAAVLDGETVVCHLEPPELYPHDSYSSRTMVLPPYSES